MNYELELVRMAVMDLCSPLLLLCDPLYSGAPANVDCEDKESV